MGATPRIGVGFTPLGRDDEMINVLKLVERRHGGIVRAWPYSFNRAWLTVKIDPNNQRDAPVAACLNREDAREMAAYLLAWANETN